MRSMGIDGELRVAAAADTRSIVLVRCSKRPRASHPGGQGGRRVHRRPPYLYACPMSSNPPSPPVRAICGSGATTA
jgi:hypothetical protein